MVYKEKILGRNYPDHRRVWLYRPCAGQMAPEEEGDSSLKLVDRRGRGGLTVHEDMNAEVL